MAAETLTKKEYYIGATGLHGGLSSENAIAVSPEKMVIADNILVGTALTRRKRGGMDNFFQDSVTVTLPVSGTAIRGICDFWRTAGVSGNPISDIFLHQGTKVISIDDRASDGVDRTGALVLSASGVPCYQVFNQIIYFCSTVPADGYNKWTGSGNATAATAPADGPGKYICKHLGRMVMAGNNDYPFRVYLSSAYDPEDWTSVAPSDSTSLDLDDDGDPEGITGIASFQKRLYVWTRKSLYEITGTQPSDFSVDPISDGIGCVGHATIVKIPNDIMFASDRGVHSLRQVAASRQSESTFQSRDLQRMWTELVNASRFKQFKASYDENNNLYLISVVDGSATTNSDIFAYNIEFGFWCGQWKDINARSMTTAYLNNRKYILIGRENGEIAYLGTSTRLDFGESYLQRFKTGVLYPSGDSSVEKIFKTITVLASTTAPATIGASWNIDGQRDGSESFTLSNGEALLGTTFILGQSSLGVGQYLPTTLTIDQVGHGIQIELTIQSEGDVEIYGYILEYEVANPVFGSRNL